MTVGPGQGELRGDAPSGAAEFFRTLALVLLLAGEVARPFLSEMPFRSSAVKGADSQTSLSQADLVQPDRLELARVTFGVLLLAAMSAWLLAGAIEGQLTIRHGWLAVLIVLFAAVALAGALHASNRRAALDDWVEQASLLGAAFLAAQLCARRRTFTLVLMALVALAGVLAAKGMWEYFVEIPDRIRAFEENRRQWLAQMGAAEGSPQAIALEGRVRDLSIIGYVSLANVLASLLGVLLLCTAGAAWDKFRAARASRVEFAKRSSRGELHLPSLMAGLLLALAAAVAATLVFTRSRGGVIAAIVALAATGVIYRYREALARRWKKALAIALIAAMLAGGAMAAYGVRNGSLPTKTMTFRWFYWTAAAEIVRQHPLLGVGGANFGTAYLQQRDVRGEEAVKNPHNVVMHALSDYGLLGGGLYLAVLGGFLLAMCRPRVKSTQLSSLPRREGPKPLVVFAAVWAAAIGGRLYFGGMDADAALAVLEAAIPGAVLAMMLAFAYWALREFFDERVPLDALRVAMACACGAFVLADMVNFALFLPGSEAVFWLCAGAAVSQAGDAAPWTLRKLRWPVAAAGLAVMVGAAAGLWWPVALRTESTNEMKVAAAQGHNALAVQLAAQACLQDTLDPLTAADAARAQLLWGDPRGGNGPIAYSLAQTAIERDPQSSAWQRLAGQIAWRVGKTDSLPQMESQGLEHMRRAVALNPQDLRLRVELAEMLLSAGDKAAAGEQLTRALQIDAGLFSDSSERFNGGEREHVQELLAKAK